MLIQLAMGIPKSPGSEALTCLAKCVDDMKVSVFVDQALQRHGIQVASIAPAA